MIKLPPGIKIEEIPIEKRMGFDFHNMNVITLKDMHCRF